MSNKCYYYLSMPSHSGSIIICMRALGALVSMFVGAQIRLCLHNRISTFVFDPAMKVFESPLKAWEPAFLRLEIRFDSMSPLRF